MQSHAGSLLELIQHSFLSPNVSFAAAEQVVSSMLPSYRQRFNLHGSECG